MRSATPTSVLVAALSGAALAQPQPWQVVVLHPPGAQWSEVTAVSATMQTGTSYLPSLGTNQQAGFWHGSALTWTPLANPSIGSGVSGSDGASQVGYVGFHAALWRGTPESRIDLHPAAGAFSSVATDVRGSIQVGGVTYSGGVHHACYWRGTPDSFVDLNPPGASLSGVAATDGVLIGGFAEWAGSADNAAIWNSVTGGVVNLNPANAWDSSIAGMAPGVQVGYADFPGTRRAALWRGSAASYVNMSPPGTTTAVFTATTGRVHAGGIPQGSLVRAAVNFGTPTSWVALQQFLPPQYGDFSNAYAVYQDGPTVYVGGSAVNGNTGHDEAILWIGTDPCYPNCDNSTTPPTLNILDFGCYLNKFASGDPYANCDGSTTPPILNVLDFACFLNRFVAGCS